MDLQMFSSLAQKRAFDEMIEADVAKMIADQRFSAEVVHNNLSNPMTPLLAASTRPNSRLSTPQLTLSAQSSSPATSLPATPSKRPRLCTSPSTSNQRTLARASPSAPKSAKPRVTGPNPYTKANRPSWNWLRNKHADRIDPIVSHPQEQREFDFACPAPMGVFILREQFEQMKNQAIINKRNGVTGGRQRVRLVKTSHNSATVMPLDASLEEAFAFGQSRFSSPSTVPTLNRVGSFADDAPPSNLRILDSDIAEALGILSENSHTSLPVLPDEMVHANGPEGPLAPGQPSNMTVQSATTLQIFPSFPTMSDEELEQLLSYNAPISSSPATTSTTTTETGQSKSVKEKSKTFVLPIQVQNPTPAPAPHGLDAQAMCPCAERPSAVDTSVKEIEDTTIIQSPSFSALLLEPLAAFTTHSEVCNNDNVNKNYCNLPSPVPLDFDFDTELFAEDKTTINNNNATTTFASQAPLDFNFDFNHGVDADFDLNNDEALPSAIPHNFNFDDTDLFGEHSNQDDLPHSIPFESSFHTEPESKSETATETVTETESSNENDHNINISSSLPFNFNFDPNLNFGLNFNPAFDFDSMF